jgi:hypothetical protein
VPTYSAMRTLQKTLFLLTLVSGLAAFANAGEDRWETLRAINWVENPTNHARYGSKGELGPYQFRSQTWKMHTKRPFSHATDRSAADEVAVKHYEWIKTGLRNAGLKPTPYRIAMAWNCGLDAVINGRVPRVTYNYAERVRNLVETFKNQREAAKPVPAPAAVVAVVEAPRLVRFNIDGSANAPMFVVPSPDAATFEPVVVAQKRPTITPMPAVEPAVEAPMFTVATVSAPRFALLR